MPLEKLAPSRLLTEALQFAEQKAKEYNFPLISEVDVLWGILHVDGTACKLLKMMGVLDQLIKNLQAYYPPKAKKDFPTSPESLDFTSATNDLASVAEFSGTWMEHECVWTLDILRAASFSVTTCKPCFPQHRSRNRAAARPSQLPRILWRVGVTVQSINACISVIDQTSFAEIFFEEPDPEIAPANEAMLTHIL